MSFPSLDWTDLRVFLAVVEQGSTKRAATTLRIDQTTASRRIAALEAAVGVALFDRTPTGFVATEAGRHLVPAVRDMGEAAGRAATLAGQLRRDRQQVLRISVADLLVDPVVQPALIDFHRRWPDVRVDLAVESRYVDVAAGEADIAIRPGDMPDHPSLVVRRLGGNPMAIYCSEAYARRHGQPTTIAEFLERPFACMEGRMLDLLAEHFPQHRPSLVATGLQVLLNAAVAGAFAVVLPSYHADPLPGLIKCFAVEADTGSVWLVYRPQLRSERHAGDLLRTLIKTFARWSRQAAAASTVG